MMASTVKAAQANSFIVVAQGGAVGSRSDAPSMAFLISVDAQEACDLLARTASLDR